VGKPEGNRSTAEFRRRWKDIEIYLNEMCWESANCVNPVQDTDGLRAVVNTVMNIRIPKKKTRSGFLDQLRNNWCLSTTVFSFIIIIIIIIIIVRLLT
jgi:hypothetical protein